MNSLRECFWSLGRGAGPGLRQALIRPADKGPEQAKPSLCLFEPSEETGNGAHPPGEGLPGGGRFHGAARQLGARITGGAHLSAPAHLGGGACTHCLRLRPSQEWTDWPSRWPLSRAGGNTSFHTVSRRAAFAV